MADNVWRLSGGLGIDPDPTDPNQVVMTQGLGFPLRPVDNVPNTDSETISDGLVAEGLFIQWMGNFEQGLYYPKGSQVRDSGFLMIANKLTLDRAAPQDDGDPSFSQPTFTPVTNSEVAVVLGGQEYTFTVEGWIKLLRVWVPALPDANISYRVIVLINPSGIGNVRATTIIVSPADIGQWVTAAAVNTSVAIGGTVSLYLESTNSGASTSVNGGWRYEGETQTGAPLAQNWTIDQQRTIFRIDKTDLDGTDRSSELEGVIPGSTIQVAQTDDPTRASEYIVGDVIDNVTYMTYLVSLVTENGGGPDAGATTSLEIDVPIPLATEYSEETGVWPAGNPAWATVESRLEFNGVNQNVLTSGFGIDIEFQPASLSPDWDIVLPPN